MPIEDKNTASALNSLAIEQKKILELVRSNQEKIDNIAHSTEHIEKIVYDILPKDHDEHHESLKRFLEHSPAAKTHGDHHDFTESVKSKIEHTIVAIFKGMGGIILISLVIGFYTWIKMQVGAK